ncbi:hypothetical protein GF337_00245 [candidate division KSB1 bacterium]|nr:hypothetical protein [candidate division KSB1 bacterium]
MAKTLTGIVIMLFIIILADCSGPQPHVFKYRFTQEKAMETANSALRQLGYKIEVFDRQAGLLKTKPRQFSASDENGDIIYQIVITSKQASEMRVKVTPRDAVDYRDEIMDPIVEKFDEAGIEAKYVPPRRGQPWKRPAPPYQRR